VFGKLVQPGSLGTGLGGAAARPVSPRCRLPNVTLHPSTAITVLPLLFIFLHIYLQLRFYTINEVRSINHVSLTDSLYAKLALHHCEGKRTVLFSS